MGVFSQNLRKSHKVRTFVFKICNWRRCGLKWMVSAAGKMLTIYML